jgi:GDP-L-fucose synthase
MNKNIKVYIAGHNGLVGSAIIRRLKKEGYNNLIYRAHKELDLINQKEVDNFFYRERPEWVFLGAAKVGGIMANIKNPSEFLYENLMIECNVLESAHRYNVKKLLFLGSSCIFPRECSQPMKEECLLDGKLEPTNEGYALAKIAGIKLCEYYNKQYNNNFISLVPSNVYGIGDNFDLNNSHVMAALIRKFHEVKVNKLPFIKVWGTGKAKREFLFVDDLADACLYFMEKYKAKELPSFINIGTGEDITIKKLAELIKDIEGYKGEIIWDTSKPNGMPRKVVDVTISYKLGWQAKTSLGEGIKRTYIWFLKKINKERKT